MTEQEWRETFVRTVRVGMRHKRMTQKELAEKTDISEKALSNYMSCIRTPNAYVVDKIMRVLY